MVVQEFFSMGGYGAYIWPAYGVAALILAGLLVRSISQMRRAQAELKLLEAQRPPRRRRSRSEED